MSLEMSKFFAGVHRIGDSPPYAVGHYKLSTLHQQVDKKKRQTNDASQKSFVVTANYNGEARAPIGFPRERTPSTSTEATHGSVGAVPSVQKRWTKGKTHLSGYKTSAGSGASAIKYLRKQVKQQEHPPTQCQLLPKKMSNNRCRRPSSGASHNLCGLLDDSPGIKWIMRPAHNFKSSSDSSSEGNGQFITLKCMGKLEIASPNLTVKTSWPDDVHPRKRTRAHDRQADVNHWESKHSRIFCVPSQRILLVDQLKQAQVRLAKPTRVRSQHKEQQHLNVQTKKQNCQSLPHKASLLLTDVVVGTTSVHNSGTVKTQIEDNILPVTTAIDLVRRASSNSSISSYQTTIVYSSTSCHQSDSIGKMWSSDQMYDNPIVEHNGNSKSIKLTSTVIKIMPETTVEKTPEPALSVRPQVHAAVHQLLKLPKRITVATSRASPTQIVTPQQYQHKPQSVCLPESPSFSPKPKIIRVEQHKIPRTMEDGIDMSYQYFVSTPLKRGKRPQTIRYLYRPMVRSLNNSPTSSKHSRKSKKNQQGQTDLENKKSLRIENELPVLLNRSTELSYSESGADSNFEAPPLKLDAKYRPLLEKLTKMPFPTELQKERKTRSGSGDAHLDRLALPPIWMPAPKSTLQSRGSEPHPSLLDYQPNATRLDSKTGAYISYHAPLHFQRMTGGGATDDSNNPTVTRPSFILANSPSPPTIAAVTYEDIELQMLQHPSNASKSVSFQLADLCSRSVSSKRSNFSLNKKPNKKNKTNSHSKAKRKLRNSTKITGRK